MLDELRQRLQTLQRPAGIEDGVSVLSLGVETVDTALGGGLARGALHEIAAPAEAHLAAATGFAVALTGLSPSPRQYQSSFRGACEASEPGTQMQASSLVLDSGFAPSARPGMTKRDFRKNLLWVAEDMALAESGAAYGPGLEAFGFLPERLVTVSVAHTRDLLWAMEEALRCRAVSAVIGELRHGEIDTVAVRRLSLKAAESGALALLLRAAPPRETSTAATRWIVGAAPSFSLSSEKGGERNARFAAQLVRNRRGPTGSWILEWSDDDERFQLATPAQPVAAPALERPHRKIA